MATAFPESVARGNGIRSGDITPRLGKIVGQAFDKNVLEGDNDQSERTIRPLTVGRNNGLFLGHPDAAPGRMQMFSVIK